MADEGERKELPVGREAGNMDKREAGMRRAEEFVTKLAQNMKQGSVAYEFRWWPEIPAGPAGAGGPNDTTMPLRVYKGNSWRSIGFAGSDIDASENDPDVFKKYESEVAQSLLEL